MVTTSYHRASFSMDQSKVTCSKSFIKQLDKTLNCAVQKVIGNRYSNIEILYDGVCVLHIDKDGLNINTDYCDFSEYIKNSKSVDTLIEYIRTLKVKVRRK